jgi:hypothetical protein
MICPVIDDQNTIDPYANPIIRLGVKGVCFAEGGTDLTRPTDGESVGTHARSGGSTRPVEIDRFIPRQGISGVIDVVVIGSLQLGKRCIRTSNNTKKKPE